MRDSYQDIIREAHVPESLRGMYDLTAILLFSQAAGKKSLETTKDKVLVRFSKTALHDYLLQRMHAWGSTVGRRIQTQSIVMFYNFDNFSPQQPMLGKDRLGA